VQPKNATNAKQTPSNQMLASNLFMQQRNMAPERNANGNNGPLSNMGSNKRNSSGQNPGSQTIEESGQREFFKYNKNPSYRKKEDGI
jgi:hypothetical protein